MMGQIVYDRAIIERNQRIQRQRGTTMVVYALVDPRNDQVRYVGITNNLLARFNEHVKDAGQNIRKQAWLHELIDAHMLPIMRTLEVVESAQSAREREIAWIHVYQESGVDLLNDAV